MLEPREFPEFLQNATDRIDAEARERTARRLLCGMALLAAIATAGLFAGWLA